MTQANTRYICGIHKYIIWVSNKDEHWFLVNSALSFLQEIYKSLFLSNLYDR